MQAFDIIALSDKHATSNLYWLESFAHNTSRAKIMPNIFTGAVKQVITRGPLYTAVKQRMH